MENNLNTYAQYLNALSHENAQTVESLTAEHIAEIRRLQSEKEQIKQQYTALQTRLEAEYRMKCDILDSETAAKRAEFEAEFMDKKDELESELEGKKHEIDSLHTANRTITQKYNNSEQKNRDLKKELKSLLETIDEKDRLIDNFQQKAKVLSKIRLWFILFVSLVTCGLFWPVYWIKRGSFSIKRWIFCHKYTTYRRFSNCIES